MTDKLAEVERLLEEAINGEIPRKDFPLAFGEKSALIKRLVLPVISRMLDKAHVDALAQTQRCLDAVHVDALYTAAEIARNHQPSGTHSAIAEEIIAIVPERARLERELEVARTAKREAIWWKQHSLSSTIEQAKLQGARLSVCNETAANIEARLAALTGAKR